MVDLNRVEVNFDGNGAYEGSNFKRQLKRTISQVNLKYGDDDTYKNEYNCTYSTEQEGTGIGSYKVRPDGAVTIQTSNTPLQAWLSRDEQMLIAGKTYANSTSFSARQEFFLGVKQGQTYDTSSLTGHFFLCKIGLGYNQDFNGHGWGTTNEINLNKISVQFDGSGNFEAYSFQRELQRKITDNLLDCPGDCKWKNQYQCINATSHSDSVIGNYAISSKGTVTIDLGETSLVGQLSEDGRKIILASNQYNSTEHSSSLSLYIGLKIGGSHDVQSLKGPFAFYRFGWTFSGADPHGYGWGVNEIIDLANIEARLDGTGQFVADSQENKIRRLISESKVYRPKPPYPDRAWYTVFECTNATSSSSGFVGEYEVSSSGGALIRLIDSSSYEYTYHGIVSSDDQAAVLTRSAYNSTAKVGLQEIIVGVRKSLVYPVALPLLLLSD